jgi:hypothetical protein
MDPGLRRDDEQAKWRKAFAPMRSSMQPSGSGIVIARTKCGDGRHDMTRFWLKLGLALALLVVPLGARAEKVLRVVPHADLKIVDPYTTTATITLMHGQMIYDQLFAWNSKLEPKPQMVDSYQISPDRLVYTFTLRPGLTVSFTTASRSPPAM